MVPSRPKRRTSTSSGYVTRAPSLNSINMLLKASFASEMPPAIVTPIRIDEKHSDTIHFKPLDLPGASPPPIALWTSVPRGPACHSFPSVPSNTSALQGGAIAPWAMSATVLGSSPSLTLLIPLSSKQHVCTSRRSHRALGHVRDGAWVIPVFDPRNRGELQLDRDCA